MESGWNYRWVWSLKAFSLGISSRIFWCLRKNFSDLGREWTRSILHNHKKLLARRPGNHSSLRHYEQVELRRHQQMAKGGGRTCTRSTKSPRWKQTSLSIQATSCCETSWELRQSTQNVLLWDFAAVRLQHKRIFLRNRANGAVQKWHGADMEDK